MKDLVQKIRHGLCRFVGEILLEAGHITENDLAEAIQEQKETKELLGQIFVRKKLITQQALVDILEIQLNHRMGDARKLHKHLGEILLEDHSITRWQLSCALNEQGISHRKIGEILVSFGFTTKGRVEQALSNQAIGAIRPNDEVTPRKSLGELLLSANRITPEQLQSALEAQRTTQGYLGDILIQQGILNEEELEDSLAAQLLLSYQNTDPQDLYQALKQPAGGGHHLTPLSPPRPIEKKLGEILVDTRQLSENQLNKAIQEQKRFYRKLGDILVEKGLVPLKELLRALRLQKRLRTLVMTTTLGTVILASCATPQVPVQIPALTNPGALMSQSEVFNPYPVSPALSGPFKTLQVGGGQNLKIYQNGSKVLENVPFFRQGLDNTCGQAVMTALLNYWGHPANYQQVVNEANPRNAPTTDAHITNFFRSKGLHAQEYRNATTENLIAQINKGRPTIILLDFGGLSQEHYVIVTGYNQKKGTFILHDSLEGPYIEMDMYVLDNMWQNKSLQLVHVFGGDNYRKIMFDVYR